MVLDDALLEQFDRSTTCLGLTVQMAYKVLLLLLIPDHRKVQIS